MSVRPSAGVEGNAVRTLRVEREIKAIKEKYPGATAVDEPDSSVGLIIPGFPIPPGFSSVTARIAVRIPALYPAEKLDLFWLDPSIGRKDGGSLPNVMSQNVRLAGEQWTQISWHDNSPHDPERISVLGFVRGVAQWFAGQAVAV